MRISCCLMVKNEAHNLNRCLDSVKDIVDEIIIVDTGSTDDTIKIAESYGAIIYNHLWQDDFSLHRNQSINYATGDWLFILDADEEVVLKITPEKFREAIEGLEDTEFNSVSIAFSDIQDGQCVMNFYSHRIFKKGCIEYEGIVHNKTNITGESIAMPEICINHYGYDLNEEQKETKYNRSKKLLLKRINEDEDDTEAYFYLVQLESVVNNLEEVVKYAEIYLEKTKERNGNKRGTIHFTTYRAYYNLEQYDKAKEWLIDRVENIHVDEPDLDIAFAFVELGMQMQDFDMINNGSTKYLLIYQALEEKKTILNGFTFTFTPQALTFVLYAATIVGMYTGVNHLRNFITVGELVNKGYTDGLIDNLNQNFKMLGINPVQDILMKCQL